ncbi:MAG TPA: DUF2975 domain-containing protein [Longimicrobiaceae bacterium]|nr:DUF2975 domain-containing protein [Longimicrobiaceae bacterium]
MLNRYPDALPVTRRVLKLLIRLNQVWGAAILVLLIASLVSEREVMTALGVRPTAPNHGLVMVMRLIMVIGIAAAPITHAVLARLLAIVETVAGGDPFVAENAARLKGIAWALVGLELLHLAVGVVAAWLAGAGARIDLNWSFSVTGWLAVLLLFVLARVFEQGSHMRADLAGTV